MKPRKYADVSIGSEEPAEIILLPVPDDLRKKIGAKSSEWQLTIQETIVRILRESLNQGRKEKLTEENIRRPIPEPTIPIETNTYMTIVNLPISLWDKITNYQLRTPKLMLFDEVITSLLETHPALIKEQKKE